MKIFWTLEPSQRQNLLVLFADGLLFWSSLASLLPTLPAYVVDVGGTKQEVGVVIGAFAIGLLLARSGLGWMADRRGRKVVLLVGTVVAAIAPLGYLFVKSIPLLIAVRAFHGVSIAAFTTSYSALVVDLSPTDRRGELLGYMSLATPIGIAVGPAIGGLLQASLGYTLLFLLASGLGLLSVLCTYQIQEEKAGSTAKPASFAPANSVEPANNLWRMLLGPRLRIPALVLLLFGLAFGAVAAFVPLFIRETKVDLNPGWFYTAAALSSFSIRIFVGRASDRYGRGLFITGSILCYSLAMLILSLAHSVVVFLLAGFLEGAGAGTLFPMMTALIADRSSASERGRVFAVCISGSDLGVAIAGPVFGCVAEQSGYRGVFTLSTGLLLVALIVFITQSSKDLRHSLRYALGQERDIYALDNRGSPSGNSHHV